jgi:Glycosyl hydrolase family 99/Calcineurin-like phosphoesterase
MKPNHTLLRYFWIMVASLLVGAIAFVSMSIRNSNGMSVMAELSQANKHESQVLDSVKLQSVSYSQSNLVMPIPYANNSVSSSINNNEITSMTLPIRAAFYYPWFPEAWNQKGISPYTNYTPTLGFYDLSDTQVIQAQIDAMLYAHIEAGIASWWGQGDQTDNRMSSLLSATTNNAFQWSIYYEPEGQGDPDISTITSDLTYIQDHYGNDPGFLHIDDRFVVFVYADASDGCGMVDRWHEANTMNAYIVLKVFPGYKSCVNQPDGWHQYAPANAVDSQGQYSYTISPGFWKADEVNPRLVRDLSVWRQSIREMIASGADFQLITTFNEWGEGTSAESAAQWATSSGYGAYLDALHNDGLVDTYSTYLPIVDFRSTAGGDPVVVAAGDIASCSSPGDEQTAALLSDLSGTVLTLGDNAYESGTLTEFNNCYNPTWGQFKDRTYPSVGNHEYKTSGAAGYFSYFGSAAGDPQKGYYSYDIGTWHIIVINSNCSEIGGCDTKSPQFTWLTADLAAHPALCTLAYWHHPLFSSGLHGNDGAVKPIWQALYNAGVELVLNGHDHDYERFAPQDPNGVADAINGIREFVVGTGGKDLRSIGDPISNSEMQNDSTWGVLRLTLHSGGYDWNFIPVTGETFTDSGSGICH